MKKLHIFLIIIGGFIVYKILRQIESVNQFFMTILPTQKVVQIECTENGVITTLHLSNYLAIGIPVVVLIATVFILIWIIKLRKRIYTSTEALIQSEKKYRSIFENAVEGIFQALPNGEILAANSAFAKLLGYDSPEELIKHNVSLSNLYTDISSRTKLLARLVKGIVKNFETTIYRRDGSIIYISINAYAVRDKNHNLLYIEGISTDITERKKAEEALKKAKEELEIRVQERTAELREKNEELNSTNEELNRALKYLKTTQSQLVDSEKMASLGQLTAGIAHEINNPINFVTSNIKPLRMDFEDIRQLFKKYKTLHSEHDSKSKLQEIEAFCKEIEPEFLFDEIESLFNGIEEGAIRTREIVMGLKNFSRLDEDVFKQANIHEGINSTLVLLKNKFKNRISIHKDYGELPTIECLPGKINQVFMNILNNAIQAIEDSGEIYIRTFAENDKVKISIRDTGVGMTEGVKKHIFEPFFTTKDVGAGTGLGLSISFGIIEKHNGKIDVKSEPEKGTEFTITLPVSQ